MFVVYQPRGGCQLSCENHLCVGYVINVHVTCAFTFHKNNWRCVGLDQFVFLDKRELFKIMVSLHTFFSLIVLAESSFWFRFRSIIQFFYVIYGWQSGSRTKNCCRQVLLLCPLLPPLLFSILLMVTVWITYRMGYGPILAVILMTVKRITDTG